MVRFFAGAAVKEKECQEGGEGMPKRRKYLCGIGILLLLAGIRDAADLEM